MDFFNNTMTKLQEYIDFKYVIKLISNPVGTFTLWMVLHYISAQLYKSHCAATGVWGFLLSPLMASTPYCSGLVWIMQQSVIKFLAIWALVGSWINYNLNERYNKEPDQLNENENKIENKNKDD